MSELNGEEISKRRMPENLKKHMLKVQGGKHYLPAAFRILWFRDECPKWGVMTDLLEGGQEAGFATVKAIIYDDEGKIIAAGHKTETKADFPAGWVEKAETGAVARALAIAGFGTQFASDMDEGDRFADSPQPSRGFRPEQARRTSETGNEAARNGTPVALAAEIWNGPDKLCPACHAPIGAKHNMKVAHSEYAED